MALLSLHSASISFGGPRLLDGVDLHIERGDRACLVGRNGTGKTTLMKVLSGLILPDEGHLTRQGNVLVAYLPQNVPAGLPGTVVEVVREGTSLRAGDEEWDAERHVQRVLTLVDIDGEQEFDSLSGGMKRRVLLARALVSEPDLLLLDEPTNHLDIASIEWLEGFIKRHVQTCLFVTHDRSFLRHVATRIIDLDRGKLADWRCDYDTFLERKERLLEDEAAQQARFDQKLAEEEVWIRKGIRARRTRNEGRVRQLERLRDERGRRRTDSRMESMQVHHAERSGAKVIEAKGLSFAWGEEPLIKDFSALIGRGDKVGIIGPNGCGKTTLLRLLLGPHAEMEDTATPVQRERIDHRTFTFELTPEEQDAFQPDAGTVERGTKLHVAYFDQHRHTLRDKDTVFDSIANGSDSIVCNGEQRNVFGYLQEFLFSPERVKAPVSILSGGERNRLLLARLFTKPANVLVLDEPTNDLDIETLELLEELLSEFKGTVLLVSHDREFLNRVATSSIVFEGDGKVREYVGGYDDWQAQRKQEAAEVAGRKAGAEGAKGRAKTRSLTNREREAMKTLPGRIEKLEIEQAELHELLATPEFYQRPPDEIRSLTGRSDKLDGELMAAYEQWAELDELFGKG